MNFIKYLSTLFFLVISAFAEEVSNMNYIDPHFSGRVEELNLLSKMLSKKKIVQVNGISGIGKTSLVSQFAKSRKNKYDVIWWINGRNDLLSQVNQFLSLIECQTSTKAPEGIKGAFVDGIISYILKTFQKKKVLIIIDDIESIQDQLTRLINEAAKENNVYVILTSQKKMSGFPSLALKSFSNNDAKELVNKFEKVSDKEAERFSKVLCNFPLAMKHALTYMNLYDLSLKNYLVKINSEKDPLSSNNRDFVEKNRKRLFNWDQKHDSADKVIKKYLSDVKNDYPRTAGLIVYLPYLSHQFVSKQFIKDFLIDFLGLKENVDDVIGDLYICNIISKNNGEDEYSFHEILKYVDFSDEEAAKKIGDFIQKELIKVRSKNFPLDQNGLREIVDHGNAFIVACEKRGFNIPQKAMVKALLSAYDFYVLRDLKHAISRVESIDIDLLANELTKEEIAYISAVKLFLLSFKYSSEPEKMSNIYKDFSSNWDIIKSSQEFDDIRLQIVSMAIVHSMFKQDMELAEKYVRYGETILDKASDPYQSLVFNFARCWWLMSMGKYEKVLSYAKEHMPLLDKVPSGTIAIYHCLIASEANLEMGNLDEAEIYISKALSKIDLYFGKRITDTKAEATTLFGSILFKKGKYKRALEISSDAMDYYRDIYDKDGCVSDQVITKCLFVKCLVALGRTKEALKKAEELISEITKISKKGSPTLVIRSVYQTIIDLGVKTNDLFLARKYMADFKEQFGERIYPSSGLSLENE